MTNEEQTKESFKIVQNKEEYRSLLREDSGKVVIVFGAPACGPCNRLKTDLASTTSKEFLEKNETIARYVDIFELGTIVDSINVLPTIKGYKNGSSVGIKLGYGNLVDLLLEIKGWYKA